MIKLKAKNKMVIPCILTAFLLIVCTLMCVLNGKVNAFAGSSGGNYAPTPHLEVKLDVNGKDGDKVSVEIAYNPANNSFKNRYMSTKCLIDAFAENATDNKTLYTIDNYKLYSTVVSSSTYSEEAIDNIYNPVNAFVAISFKTASTAASGKYEVQTLGFNALKVKADAFVTFTFEKVAGKVLPTEDKIDINVRFNILSTIAMVDKNTKPITWVGNKTSVPDSSIVVGSEIPAINMRNNTPSFLFDFNEQLLNRRLYNEVNRANVLITKDGGSPWTINDASYLRFSSANVKFSNGYIRDEDIQVYMAPTSDKPTEFLQVVYIKVNITEDTVAKYNSDNAGDANAPTFWDKTHALTLELRSAFNTEYFSFKFNVKFIPDDKLSPKTIYTMPNALNASSTSSFVREHTVEGKKNGYKTVSVYPNYITDYPFTTKQIFKSSEKPEIVSGTNIVEISEKKDENNVIFYDITGIETGQAKVKFKVWSGAGQDTENIVYINFTVYGQYTIKFEAIEGKKTKVFEPTSAEFKKLFDDSYYLQDFDYVNEESKNIVILRQQGNNLSIAPKASGEAKFTLTFANHQNKIVIESSVFIDIEGGSIFNKLEDWQVWLIIIGASILIIAILLLIIWLFIRGISKKKRDELETSAPTSAYIIKLNSTIAAAQAQQRLATTQAFSNAQTQMLQLGAGPTTTPAPGGFNTLQLGSAPVPPSQATNYSGGAMSMPPMGDIIMPPPAPPGAEEIFIPLSDDELLERIFVEKYEPRGMARRSFFKSKELQAKELEKEKNRIREDVRGGMTIEEACKPKSSQETVIASAPAAIVEEKETTSAITILGFDPTAAVEVAEETNDEDPGALEEQKRLVESQRKLKKIQEVNEQLEERLKKANSELAKANKIIEEDNATIKQCEDRIAKYQEDITDLEIKLASAKNKDKEKFSKDIESREKEIESNKSKITALNNGLEEKNGLVSDFDKAVKTIEGQLANTQALVAETNAEIELRSSQAKLAIERETKAKAQQELNRRIDYLTPMFVNVNTADMEVRKLENAIEQDTMERNERKAEVSRIQAQLLSATDSSVIGNLNNSITSQNKRISELDKSITANTKIKADKNIEITGLKRKANDYIDKENIDVEHIIRSEDNVIGDLTLAELAKHSEMDKEKCEKDMLAAQALYDDLSNSSDARLMEAVSSVAASIKQLEEEVNTVQTELDDLNSKMDDASDDDKLMLSIDQMSVQEKLNELSSNLENAKANGIKTNLEMKLKCEEEVENARVKLENAKEEFEKSSTRYNESINSINPLDLIISGSGVVSQERSKIEAANLKKQLEQSKNAIEQAKLQAQMAQMEAEKAIIDAKRASDASKDEAEKLAKEAIAKAEKAKQEAESKAQEEAEKIKLEAAEAAEKAKREAAEEMEKAKREAAEEIEKAKREAAEESERAKQENEETKKSAEEQITKVKQQAEEQVVKVKQEAEEAEKARQEAEEKAKRELEEKAANIAAKVERRKVEILELRKDLKNITNEDEAFILKEKFFALSKTFDEDERNDMELRDLINKSIDDSVHAKELNLYKQAANKAPRKTLKKVIERVNQIPKRPAGAAPRPGAPVRPGARPAGAAPRPGAPVRPGARPAGAAPRPGAPVRPGVRPAGAAPRPGAPVRPGARPAGAAPRPGAPTRPGARPAGSAPRSGAPTRPGPRPTNKP